MIKISNTDGKTIETAIVITDAENDREAWIFIKKYLEYYLEYNEYDYYEDEEYGDTFDQFMRIYHFFKNGKKVDELWIDYTICFHKWDK